MTNDVDFEIVQDHLRRQPLLNHKSELYDDSTHVRVRILSPWPLPIDFKECLETSVEEDKTSNLMKPSTYTTNIEYMKSKVYDYFFKEKDLKQLKEIAYSATPAKMTIDEHEATT